MSPAISNSDICDICPLVQQYNECYVNKQLLFHWIQGLPHDVESILTLLMRP